MTIKVRTLILLALIIIVTRLSFIIWDGDKLKPYTSDGCSSFPDGTLSQRTRWADCCFEHDIAYWKGGTYQQKKAADNTLAQCVSKAGNPKVIAPLMLAGVSVGGSAYFPTTFRWGYGWHYLRGYKALTDDEKKRVKAQIKYQQQMIEKLQQKL